MITQAKHYIIPKEAWRDSTTLLESGIEKKSTRKSLALSLLSHCSIGERASLVCIAELASQPESTDAD